MAPEERIITAQFGGAVLYVILFAVGIGVVWVGGLVPLGIGAAFGLVMFWNALHNEDFRFGQHDEDTPYTPSDAHRYAISYRDVDHAALPH